MKQEINTFIFDCFGVICDPPISSWHKENIINKGFLKDKLFDEILMDFDLGNLSEEGLVEYFLKNDGVNSTKIELREKIDSYLKLDNNLATIILKLKNKGFKTVLLSNGNAE